MWQIKTKQSVFETIATYGADTTLSGKAFHMLTMRIQKKSCIKTTHAIRFISFIQLHTVTTCTSGFFRNKEAITINMNNTI